MPELPDIEAYLEALRPRVVGQRLEGVALRNPFLLRTFDPPLDAVRGGTVVDVSRVGKRVVLEVEAPGAEMPYFLVIHLMIAGRLQWRPAEPQAPSGAGGPPRAGAARTTGGRSPGGPRGNVLAAFEFSSGTLYLTEAGSKRRASLHLVHGRDALAALDPGGMDIFSASPGRFLEALRRENRTLKRVLTDPHLFSGIGNAYSDEILHRACLSPFKLSRSLSDEQASRLLHSAQMVLREWSDRLSAEARERFPEKVTAFRPDMAVHGKFGARCPVCGQVVQRIVYADNECDYCPGCQTGGRILADRSLSRLLKEDWPRAAARSADED
jgi:formamidopyrimidine-DNA glycosylase